MPELCSFVDAYLNVNLSQKRNLSCSQVKIQGIQDIQHLPHNLRYNTMYTGLCNSLQQKTQFFLFVSTLNYVLILIVFPSVLPHNRCLINLHQGKMIKLKGSKLGVGFIMFLCILFQIRNQSKIFASLFPNIFYF